VYSRASTSSCQSQASQNPFGDLVDESQICPTDSDSQEFEIEALQNANDDELTQPPSKKRKVQLRKSSKIYSQSSLEDFWN
jgi:hypothetical protein